MLIPPAARSMQVVPETPVNARGFPAPAFDVLVGCFGLCGAPDMEKFEISAPM